MSRKSSFETAAVRLLLSLGIIFLSLHLLGVPGENAGGLPETARATEYNREFSPDDPVVILYLRDYSLLPHLKVLVNSEVRGTFQSRYVTVPVHSGDTLAIDGTFYSQPLSIEVLSTSKAITSPRSGEIVHLNGNVAHLGRVAAADH
jgi:hypothetical protein